MGGRTRTLYIFPHAGGSAEDYRAFARTVTSDIRCVAVQYPGRSGVHDLASFTSISDLADQVIGTMKPAEGRFAFFGHSMGGLLAFEVAIRLQAEGNLIDTLFVSACAAPGLSGNQYIAESDRDLLDVVSELTGAAPEFLENEEFASRILPSLRGFKAIVDYTCPPDATLRCPIVAFYGDTDEIATHANVSAWAGRTSSEFSMRAFPGHHFYLNDHLSELAGEIERRIGDDVRVGDRTP